MTETMERNEAQVAEVDLTSTILGLAKHTELDVKKLQGCADDSDSAWEREEHEESINAARALLGWLVKGIALDMRRPVGESVEMFRARDRHPGGFHQCCRFLQQKLFFGHEEKNNAKRAFGAASVPAEDSGVSVEAWGRIARRMVFTTVKLITARYDDWKTGCSCERSPVEVILFQPVGGASVYHRSICRQCRCPREPYHQERAMTACDGEAAGEDGVRPATSADGSAGVSNVPSELLRSPFDLPSELSEALNGLDTPKLMSACVRSVQLLCERR